MKLWRKFFWLILLFPGVIWAQRTPDPQKGDAKYTQWGILDGNNVRTLYANHGEIARWPDQPSGEWPKGSGHSYVDGVALIVAASTRDTTGKRIHPMSTAYREFCDQDPVTKVLYGWAPLPGYSNPRQGSPARSDDPNTWPSFWPDQPLSWAGKWNGYFGQRTNADVETYFVLDDSPDKEWLTARPDGSGVFYPDRNDSTRGGLGMEVAVRGFQWSHVLAQDVIFWLYEITNESTTDYDSVYFAQYIDWGIGGTDDSGDDEGGYNLYYDIAFAWDFDKQGTPGHWTPVGTCGYAFLESPGNHTDGKDNDEDGITDENRNDEVGQLIIGQDNIRSYVEAYYNRSNFEKKYGSLENRYPYQIGYWWTGDEEMDWRPFLDMNGNGIWDQGEPLNDDLGEDGLGPYHAGYPGPDVGEGDGRPTQGEPNYGQTDKDESDQIGLTGFRVMDVHEYELIDDEKNWHDLYTQLQPPHETYLEGGRNLGMFFSSGPFPMKAGQTERFSMALLFAPKDFPDAPTNEQFARSALARKKETVQQIYNADYQFATPPNKPILHAIPGDGCVVLYWDNTAEMSYDPFLQEYDFEGYKLYRSTEPFFIENQTITNGYGEKMFKEAIFQCDLANEWYGFHPVATEGTQYNLGNNTGLTHFYVDRDVVNGMTYYYALVAYDHGQIGRDPAGNILLDEQGQVRGIAPSECTANIKVDISGNVQVDVNTRMVTPRPYALGFQVPEFANLVHNGPGTGTVDFQTIISDSLKTGHVYRLSFSETSAHYNQSVPYYQVTDQTTGAVLVAATAVGNSAQEVPLFDGISALISNDSTVSLVYDSCGWMPGSKCNYLVEIKKIHEDETLLAEFGNLSVPYPADFLIQFEDQIVDSSLQLGLTRRPTKVPFKIFNVTENRYAKVGVKEVLQGGSVFYDRQWQVNEPILILAGDSAWLEPKYPGHYKVCWAIHLYPPENPAITPVPPQPGDVIKIKTRKPFRQGEYYEFSVKGAYLDEKKIKHSLDEVYVVPNPYVATNIFEPRNPYKTGRGERRLYFMNVPPKCDITIYTKAGHVVDRIHHEAQSESDGMVAWDLLNKDDMEVAYGVYFYVVEYEGKTKAGRFAIIK